MDKNLILATSFGFKLNSNLNSEEFELAMMYFGAYLHV